MMKILKLFGGHWPIIAAIGADVALGVMLLLARAEGAEWKRTAEARQATIDEARRAVTVANGWPAGRLIRTDQLAVQIGIYGRFIADTRLARASAEAGDLSRARATEARQDRVTQETEHALLAQLDDARAAAARLAARLRLDVGQAGDLQGGGGSPDRTARTDTAGGPDAAGRAPLVDAEDLRICSENTVKAQGWQDWYRRVFPSPATE